MKYDLSYDPIELRNKINWAAFLFAWGFKHQDSLHFEAQKLKSEAAKLLQDLSKKHFKVKARLIVLDAFSREDDIIITSNKTTITIPCLRQQTLDAGCSVYKCLADYLAPENTNHPIGNKLVLFATTFKTNDNTLPTNAYQQMLLQTLSDRLAEAAAEETHNFALCHIWNKTNDAPIWGIRPAIGYPSLPDMSLNFVLDHFLEFESMGISLTSSGMMDPHASVSGLLFAHPQATYFNLGKISKEQLIDYAKRRQTDLHSISKYIRSEL